MTPDSEMVSILLLAFDKLRGLLDGYHESNQVDISEFYRSGGSVIALLNPSEVLN